MNITEELSQLEEMHRKGTLNDDEFRKAKERVLGTSAATATQEQPVPKELPSKKSGFLDPKANLKALGRVFLLLIILVAIVWFIISRAGGTRVATNLAKAVAHAPMTLHDGIENIQASSWKGIPINLPYSGTLSVSVEVTSGNKIDVFLTDGSNFEKFKKDDKQFRVFMQAAKTQNFKQSARIAAGLYYLVLRDTTLGVLSSQTSDIKVIAKLE